MYSQVITESLAAIGRSDIDPRHAEGFMRVERGALDALSREDFRHECQIAAACVDEGGRELAEQVADSYGL